MKFESRIVNGSILVLLLGFLFSLCAAVPGRYHASLYKDNVDIFELSTEFNDTISGSKYLWLVQFYNSWCGHCQRFAPFYKRLASNLRDWNRYVHLAVVACSDRKNRQLCQEQNVKKTPGLKVFLPGSDVDSGRMWKQDGHSDSIQHYRRSLLAIITSLPTSKRNNWPNIQTHRKVDEGVLSNGNLKALLAVYENSSSIDDAFFGQQLVMDFSFDDDIVVQRIAGPPAGSDDSPVVREISKDILMSSGSLDVDDVKKKIKYDFLHMEKSTPPVKATNSEKIPITKQESYNFIEDIEVSLDISLEQEISLHSNFPMEKKDLIVRHLRLLQLLPVSASSLCYLEGFRKLIDSFQSLFTNVNWIVKLKEAQTSHCYLTKETKWQHCEGSKPELRGYPCSLWTTFHILTVAAYNSNGKHKVIDVLRDMKQYIGEFFRCGHCSANFANESAQMENAVSSDRSGVLWLWRIHNLVNHRLHGDISEDPHHPKMQFPSFQMCPMCHNKPPASPYDHSEWDEDEVFAFLSKFYSPSSVVSKATQNILAWHFIVGMTLLSFCRTLLFF